MRSFLLLSIVATASAFVTPSATFVGRPSASTLLKDGESNIETIEFRIFPDGRVEEVVRGVKGMNCNKVTDEINAVLGKVVDTAPTEEMFQQDLTIDTEITISEGSDWEGSSTW
mmetsp:Transcript_13953/g.23193  ORF Transcript_13953/g.23193 Transcript_13953/m.23193 type:complete len:114 (+) Transcript_13953:147-488(+)|eukprot:CAMPEP_0119006566 /NCGR_PEP_ID=MMETSP1176-20130426/2375_1 /TAXON_ID=265551 /ORGANISM="Synedropsis recta cf, Strain CCMP1620" /LENGTH=113 /DNA_ID=CAMNT_0006958495 /DNA_START=147 /DNA_END=488 /DNA_ORIENTATION=-